MAFFRMDNFPRALQMYAKRVLDDGSATKDLQDNEDQQNSFLRAALTFLDNRIPNLQTSGATARAASGTQATATIDTVAIGGTVLCLASWNGGNNAVASGPYVALEVHRSGVFVGSTTCNSHINGTDMRYGTTTAVFLDQPGAATFNYTVEVIGGGYIGGTLAITVIEL